MNLLLTSQCDISYSVWLRFAGAVVLGNVHCIEAFLRVHLLSFSALALTKRRHRPVGVGRRACTVVEDAQRAAHFESDLLVLQDPDSMSLSKPSYWSRTTWHIFSFPCFL